MFSGRRAPAGSPLTQRIGEALIERGLITPGQLSKALSAQLIFGGHLGTVLIELGFTDEESLGSTLAEILRFRYATAERLASIPANVIATITRRTAEKQCIVPMRLDGRTLHVAMIGVKSLATLSTATGCKIVAWISPEIRIFQALEKYYGIPRRPRYITICRELDRRKTERIAAPCEEANMAPAMSPGPSSEEAALWFGPPLNPSDATEEDALCEFGYGKSWRDIVDEQSGEAETDRQAKMELEEEARRVGDVDGVLVRMSQAQTKADLTAAVLDFVSHHMSGCMLFGIRSETAYVWDWRGVGISQDKIADVGFPVLSDSIFTVLLGREYYQGPVPDRDECFLFYERLQLPVPEEILLLPVYFNDRLVAVLYGEAQEGGEIAGDLEVYLRLTERLALALSMIVLKAKITS